MDDGANSVRNEERGVLATAEDQREESRGVDESDEKERKADGWMGGCGPSERGRGNEWEGGRERGAEFRACSASSPSTAATAAVAATAGC